MIINRPTSRSLAELLPGERFRRFTNPIFFGGPGEPGACSPLFRADGPRGASIGTLPGVYLALDPDASTRCIDSPPPEIRFFAGYSGWAPGQLEAEIGRGDWFVVEGDTDAIFRKDTSTLWQDMVRRASAVHAGAVPR